MPPMSMAFPWCSPACAISGTNAAPVARNGVAGSILEELASRRRPLAWSGIASFVHRLVTPGSQDELIDLVGDLQADPAVSPAPQTATCLALVPEAGGPMTPAMLLANTLQAAEFPIS